MNRTLNELETAFAELKENPLNLNLMRGKPCKAQLDLSDELLRTEPVTVPELPCSCPSGEDYRNYGKYGGIDEARRLFAEYMGVGAHEILVLGNSSNVILRDVISEIIWRGLPGHKPWKGQKIKFICPSPGYDRHWDILEEFGIEMIPVEITPGSLDIDKIEELVKGDPDIKGIICVPKYSNPTGNTYNADDVYRLAGLITAADDFVILWDNAYAHHDWTSEEQKIPNLLVAAEEYDRQDRVFMFGSTSKVTFAGAGVTFISSTPKNLKWFSKNIRLRHCGDKLNQSRHVQFLDNLFGIKTLMLKHGQIIYPKFQAVKEVLCKELGGTDLAKWKIPNGGYFIPLYLKKEEASRVAFLAREIGLSLTPAGSGFPNKTDPNNNFLRLCVTFIDTVEEVKGATEALAICIQLSYLRK